MNSIKASCLRSEPYGWWLDLGAHVGGGGGNDDDLGATRKRAGVDLPASDYRVRDASGGYYGGADHGCDHPKHLASFLRWTKPTKMTTLVVVAACSTSLQQLG